MPSVLVLLGSRRRMGTGLPAETTRLLARTAEERPGSLALGALVFGAGIGALATEITASRLLAPYFGSSTIVWANLIGIVLAALALGYWLGGRTADRATVAVPTRLHRPRRLGLRRRDSFVAKPFLDLTVEGLDSASAGAVIGSFLAVLLLCAPPVVLLGMVSPFAIRLAVSSIETAGTVAGRLYALSTQGSLLGTFLPALVLIPAIGTQRTFLRSRRCSPRLILFPARRALSRRRRCAGRSRGRSAQCGQGGSWAPARGDVVLPVHPGRRESDGRRLLSLNEGVAVHSMWRPDSVLTGGVWDAFLAVPPLLDRPLERVAILGNAAGRTARALGVYYPEASIDGVELDPAVSRVGRRYFAMDENPRSPSTTRMLVRSSARPTSSTT